MYLTWPNWGRWRQVEPFNLSYTVFYLPSGVMHFSFDQLKSTIARNFEIRDNLPGRHLPATVGRLFNLSTYYTAFTFCQSYSQHNPLNSYILFTCSIYMIPKPRPPGVSPDSEDESRLELNAWPLFSPRFQLSKDIVKELFVDRQKPVGWLVSELAIGVGLGHGETVG